jgi:hypothetical protein
MVTNLKIKWPSSLINITFRSRLCGFHVLLDNSDPFFSFFNKINVIVPSLSRLNPIQQRSALSAIQGFKQNHLNTLLITVIIEKLS